MTKYNQNLKIFKRNKNRIFDNLYKIKKFQIGS